MPTYLTPGVYVEEMPSGSMPLSAVGTAVAAFIGYTAKAPTDDPTDPDGLKPRMVTSWSQYTKLYGEYTNSALLPHAVRGFFLNGGGRCYIVRIPHRTADRYKLTVGSKAALPAGSSDEAPAPLEFINLAEDGEVVVDIKPTPPDPKAAPDKGGKDAKKPDTAEAVAKPPTFDITITKGSVQESYSKLTMGKSGKYAPAEINSQSKLVEVISTVDDATLVIPATTHKLAAPTTKTIQQADFDGHADDRSGVEGLKLADDVTMVMVPDLITAAKASGTFDPDLWTGVQNALVAHCEGERNRMAILDPPPQVRTPQEVHDWRVSSKINSKFATLYYPWLTVNNPVATNGNKKIEIPPCGHMAGIWARTDSTRGVWKAPANEQVLGVLDVVTPITKGEQEILNPNGINAIRAFGAGGLKVWGARTLSDTDPSWKYINVRRLFNMIETTIMDGTQWVVFEPNDQALWQRVARTVNAFLLGLWRDGALFGATPDQAFYVKCDAETNPPESIDEGKLIVEVGVAPVKPAEFVIFRIGQKSLSSAAG